MPAAPAPIDHHVICCSSASPPYPSGPRPRNPCAAPSAPAPRRRDAGDRAFRQSARPHRARRAGPERKLCPTPSSGTWAKALSREIIALALFRIGKPVRAPDLVDGADAAAPVIAENGPVGLLAVAVARAERHHRLVGRKHRLERPGGNGSVTPASTNSTHSASPRMSAMAPLASFDQRSMRQCSSLQPGAVDVALRRRHAAARSAGPARPSGLPRPGRPAPACFDPRRVEQADEKGQAVGRIIELGQGVDEARRRCPACLRR